MNTEFQGYGPAFELDILNVAAQKLINSHPELRTELESEISAARQVRTAHDREARERIANKYSN
jgi:hypothetical protein